MLHVLGRMITVVAASLAALLLLGTSAGAQQLPGPIAGLDEYTVALGTFDDSVAFTGPGGTNLLKSTALRHPAGMFNSSALFVPNAGGVAIHSSDGFDVAQGTIEMWVRRGVPTLLRQDLLSVQGKATLSGGPYNALVIGEASASGPAFSKIWFDGPQGLQPSAVARLRTSIPRGISVGDVDGDGVRDIVASMRASGRVEVYRGPFAPGQTYAVSHTSLIVPHPQGNTLADLDGDGDLDLLVCSYDPAVAPLFGFENQGDGSFAPLDLEFYGVGTFAEGMAMGDVDQDGVLDVLFASLDTTQPSAVLLGLLDDQGHWGIDLTVGALYSPLSFACLGACLADVDGDGWLDAVLTRPVDDEVVVHLNQGDGSFRTVPDLVVPSFAPFTVAAGKDVDNDGYLDIATANWRHPTESSFASKVYLGPDFTQSLSFPVENAVSSSLGDLDGDGWLDLFLRSSTATTSRLYYLDLDGGIQGSLALPTSPTDLGSEPGPGIGVLTAVTGGTMSYAPVLDRSNGFELFLLGDEIHFRVTDARNRVHQVLLPFPLAGGGPGGFRHVRAEWSLREGRLDLRVLPLPGATEATYRAGGPIEVTAIQPQFRVGTDLDNQRPCRACRLDDVRISNVRRSQIEAP